MGVGSKVSTKSAYHFSYLRQHLVLKLDVSDVANTSINLRHVDPWRVDWKQNLLNLAVFFFLGNKTLEVKYIGNIYLPRGFNPVPKPIINGQIWILYPSNTRSHIPQEAHLAFAHLYGQEVSLHRKYENRSNIIL